jgi:L-ascorbate metabolism protein UlaG (beta-lactamase superfamily)
MSIQIPPTNGWMLELGYTTLGNDDSFHSGYRIYISGDTLLVDDLKEIPVRYAGQNIDLMLIHLGGTTLPSPSMPLLMVTMDAAQGLGLVRLINPDVTIPIHYDDYDVFLSPLEDFKKAVEQAGLSDKVVYLDRKDKYEFEVKGGK